MRISDDRGQGDHSESRADQCPMNLSAHILRNVGRGGRRQTEDRHCDPTSGVSLGQRRMSPTTCRRVCCEFAMDRSGSTTLPLHSSLGLQVYTQTATTEGEIDAAFKTLTKHDRVVNFCSRPLLHPLRVVPGALFQFAALRRLCPVTEALAPSRPGIRDACS